MRYPTYLYWIASVIALAVILAIWYDYTYSMGVVKGYEINDASLDKRLLVATQESPYKRVLTHQLIERLDTAALYIRVIDVTQLPDYKCFEIDGSYAYDAIVIMHTWQYGEPPTEVTDFLRSVECDNSVFLLTTSGSGTARVPDYDGLSSASVHSALPGELEDIVTWVDRRLWWATPPEGAAAGARQQSK
ncbi:hypothetical protein LEM8419_01839 [Neolewinella maritima]|uniref:Uncharacterized protein n=1 Tax=Neolewinella maritima TaxID=1383882 RepID=A0ABM9B0X5_9BACT|nr:hypothetical protein [Neolewinella maritima]CAH1000705.1 hypothetical protein LEM8419_01839 [Neolewinella maritima]